MDSDKTKKASICIVILLIMTISGLGITYLLNIQTDDSNDATDSVRIDVKIYDLVWRPVIKRTHTTDPTLSYLGSYAGKEEVLKIENQRLVAQFGAKSGFRDIATGVALFSLYVTETQNYVIQFKTNNNPTFLHQEQLSSGRWHDFKILFNSKTDQYRTYVNGQQIYANRSFINDVDYINGIEIYGGYGGYEKIYLSFNSIIGYNL
jgi:hypothetical protein